MKSYYGNYLGVVITGGDKDPEHRGRTQVFVPNIMPALYENWNEPGEDITFEVIGQGLDGSLNPQIIDRLRNTLPWAECAAPITGASPSYGTSVGGFVSETIRNVGKAAEAVGEFLGDVKDRVFGGVQDSGVDFTKDENAWSGAFISYAAGAGDPSFPRNLKHTNYAAAVRDGKSANWTAVDPRTTELQPGDIVVKNRGGGNFNYSDFQNGKTDGASSHGDVVVSVSGGTAKVVGGNVSNKVTGYSVNARGGGGAFVVLRPKSQEIANKVAGNATNEMGNWQKNSWSEGSSSARDTLNAYWQAGQSGKPFPDTALAGQPNVSPSALPNPQATTNMQPDPTQEQQAATALDSQQKVDLGMQSSSEQMSLGGKTTGGLPIINPGDVTPSGTSQTRTASVYGSVTSDFTTYLDVKPEQRPPEATEYWRSRGYDIEKQEAQLRGRLNGWKPSLNLSDTGKGAYLAGQGQANLTPGFSVAVPSNNAYGLKPGSFIQIKNSKGEPIGPNNGYFQVADKGNSQNLSKLNALDFYSGNDPELKKYFSGLNGENLNVQPVEISGESANLLKQSLAQQGNAALEGVTTTDVSGLAGAAGMANNQPITQNPTPPSWYLRS